MNQSFFESPITFAVMVLIFCVGRALDIYSSVGGEYYGLNEAVPFSKDAAGNFSLPKNLIGSAAFLGLGVVLGTFVNWGAGTVILAPLGLYSFYQAYANFRLRRVNRSLQLGFMRQMRDDAAGTFFPTNIAGIRRNNNTQRFYYPLWRYIAIPSAGATPEYDEFTNTEFRLQAIIRDRAKTQPESEWFT